MLQFKDVPYRRYHAKKHNHPLVVTKQYRRIMGIVGRAISDGKSVEFEHKITGQPRLRGNAYDTISVTIQD